ncbi:hypothetical protein [Caudoviricetes sp.]|nr:hypothetical protein [Caudoviricetes sp.]UOF81525.1 hypothetical protein [Caudoviricetes sp.]
MSLQSIITFFTGYRGRRHFGFSRTYPAAPRPRARVRIQLGGQE